MSDFATFHEKFSPEEFEAQYNLRVSRPDFDVTVIADWQARSDAAGETMICGRDIRYGDGERQKLDVYPCGETSAPTLVYFHGGYWHRGDKSLYAFLAQPFVAAGVNVVVIGYDLCPTVTLTRISEEAREAMAYIRRNAADLGVNRDRILVMGHSAGGHIAEMMMGTDWPALADDLPKDLIKAGIPISPLSLLEPVRLTQGLNAEIRIGGRTRKPNAQPPPENQCASIGRRWWGRNR